MGEGEVGHTSPGQLQGDTHRMTPRGGGEVGVQVTGSPPAGVKSSGQMTNPCYYYPPPLQGGAIGKVRRGGAANFLKNVL